MFEQVAISIREVAEQHKETEKSFEAQLKEIAEQHKDFEQSVKAGFKEVAEQQKKTDERIRKLAEQMGFYGNRLGEFTEHLLAPGIAKSFNALGYEFDQDDVRRLRIKDSETGNDLMEIDFLLENDDTFLVVEIKTKPSFNDVKDHVKRLRIFRRHLEEEGRELKKIIGAIGGVVFEKNIKIATRKAGFFVMTQKGEDVQIDVPDDFVPKIF
jgi:hypothetical protein